MGSCIGVSGVDLKYKSKQDVCTHALGGLAPGASQRPVAVDLLDDGPLQDRRDDLELAAAAVRTVLHVDVEPAGTAADLPAASSCSHFLLFARAQSARILRV